jgi:DNA-directed RNA polymerase beta' subunit
MSTVKLLDMDKFTRTLKEVSSTDIWISKGTFHPDGLFSETIFGPIETPARRQTFGYINLNTKVIHPALISIIKRMNRNLLSAINRENHYTLNELGYLVSKEDGEIYGLTSVLDNFNKMRFRGGSEKRDDLVDMLNYYRKVNQFFISKVPVMPVPYRDIVIKADGRKEEDPINAYYKSILILSLQLKTIPSGAIFDVLSSNMQEAVHTLYDYIAGKISKKEGLIRHDILGKRIDYSARAVVTGAGSELKSDEIGIRSKVAFERLKETIFPYLEKGFVIELMIK